MSKRALLGLFAAGLVSLACVVIAVLGVRAAQSSEPNAAVVQGPSSKFRGALLPEGVRAPDFSLRDEQGRRVTMREYRGKPVVATFMYAQCDDACPAQAQQIKGAFDQLGRDFPALAVSVDPKGDTPENAQKFNVEQGVGGRIRWVLGSKSELTGVWKGFASTGGRDHLERIVLIDKRGFQRVGYPLREVTPERLAYDLRVLERE